MLSGVSFFSAAVLAFVDPTLDDGAVKVGAPRTCRVLDAILLEGRFVVLEIAV